MTLLWSSLFTIIVVGLALWVLYYIIRAAVSAGIKDAYAQMGFIREPDTKEDQLQRRREELQEERVQTIEFRGGSNVGEERQALNKR